MDSVFAYTTAGNALLYRTIMQLFVESRERFVFHLRPENVFAALRAASVQPVPGQEEINLALTQLCEWGHLQTHPDLTPVTRAEDFLKPRHVFRLTNLGEAAQRAVAQVETATEREVDLRCAALADIRHVIQDLHHLSQEPEPDAGKILHNLIVLRARFEELTATAQTLMDHLESRLRVPAPDARQLIEFGERFLGELVLAASQIAETVRSLGPAGFERLIRAVAKREAQGAIDTTPDCAGAVFGEWRLVWESVCRWFISQPGRLSAAEKLREHIRTSIPAVLSVIAQAERRRSQRVSRSNDFRALARWFTEAESEADAHRLWRAVFGLCSARHLPAGGTGLNGDDVHPVPPNTSWLGASSLRPPTRFRGYVAHCGIGGLSRIIDRTAEKEKLAAASREEALRFLHAQKRFGAGGRVRLSELGELLPDEFDLFLDILGEAMPGKMFPSDAVEILSGDGCLRVKLEPTGDGRSASIPTPEGVFSGPDHWISIEQLGHAEVVV